MSADQPNQQPELSVIVPVYNEEDTIGDLLTEIEGCLAKLPHSTEILIVDDGSSDGTADLLRRRAEQNPQLRILTNAKNSGQGASLYRGLKEAGGKLLVTMDGDGQNDPADIPQLIDALGDDDMVVGIRQGRQDSQLRKSMSRFANGIRARILGDGVSDSGCALKVMRREVVDALIPMQTLYSFIPALVAGAGFKVKEIPVAHRHRQGGTSHYGLLKMLWRPLVDMMGVCWFNHRRCNPASADTYSLPWLAIVTVIAYFLFLGCHGLIEPDEGRYAEVAREMQLSGDIITPSLNGFSHVEKPPVIYWFTALSFQLFGVSEFSARLPVALASLGILLLTFRIAGQIGGRRCAWLSAAVLASAAQYFFMGRFLTADVMMGFWITAAVAALVHYRHQPDLHHSSRWLFFIFMGIGFLTKGPMALVVPVSAAIGIGWGRKEVPRLPWIRGLLLFLAVALSWFIVLSAKNPGLADYFYNTEFKERFLTTNHGRSQPFWFFLPVLLVGFLPWTLFLVPFVLRKWKRLKHLTPTTRFLLFWVALPLIILSCSGSKLISYILPVLPGVAIMLGREFARDGLIGRSRILLIGATTLLLSLALLYLRLWVPADTGFATSFATIMVIAATGIGILRWSRSAPFTASSAVPVIAFASILVWLTLASQVEKGMHLLGRQASMKQIAQTLQTHPNYPDARIIASNIRAHGLEFYLLRMVDATEGQADLIIAPTDAQKARLHRKSKKVAQLAFAPKSPTFVVTRSHDYHKHFVPTTNWQVLRKTGDFYLLEQTGEPEDNLAGN